MYMYMYMCIICIYIYICIAIYIAIYSRNVEHVLQKCRFFQMSKLKCWNMYGSIYRISKHPDLAKIPKIQIYVANV